jgi:hypothetical protein
MTFQSQFEILMVDAYQGRFIISSEDCFDLISRVFGIVIGSVRVSPIIVSGNSIVHNKIKIGLNSLTDVPTSSKSLLMPP